MFLCIKRIDVLNESVDIGDSQAEMAVLSLGERLLAEQEVGSRLIDDPINCVQIRAGDLDRGIREQEPPVPRRLDHMLKSVLLRASKRGFGSWQVGNALGVVGQPELRDLERPHQPGSLRSDHDSSSSTPDRRTATCWSA